MKQKENEPIDPPQKKRGNSAIGCFYQNLLEAKGQSCNAPNLSNAHEEVKNNICQYAGEQEADKMTTEG